MGHVDRDELELREVHRFRNGGVQVGEALYWDVLGLWREVVTGLSAAGRSARAERGASVSTVGVDSWAIDYGLLGSDGMLLGNPRHYRDARSAGVAEHLLAGPVSLGKLYQKNGLQHLPFTTLYQLVAEARDPLLAAASTLLLIPDLFGYWLSGHRGAEATNVSTTGLADVRTGRWDPDLVALAGIRADLLPEVHEPGVVLGALRPQLLEQTGLPASVRLTSVGSHDTASAVVAVPARDERFAYIACGTWALVGVELEQPLLTEQSRSANFTNERGVDGRVRYLRNVTGLWVLNQCLAEWEGQGRPQQLERLLADAAAVQCGPVVDIDAPELLPPGPMVSRLRHATQDGLSDEPAVITRCILDGLARAFALALRDAVRLSGKEVDVVHMVGGGARNALLCQLTADACEMPVLAGPVEATALGNVLVQARASGTVTGTVDDLRALVARTHRVLRYEPRAVPIR